MIAWGISAASHNAALAVFKDGQLVFASEAERFSKIKNDANLNADLVAYARQWGDPDEVCWYESPWLKTARQLYAGQGFVNNRIKPYLAKYNIAAPVVTQPHHRSHAAAGYYTSGFDQACVVVIDAIGEFETTTIWQGHQSTLTKLWNQHYPQSLGLWYSAMTQRIGLKPNEEEYILMGMAAYGHADRLINDMINDFVDLDSVTFKQNFHQGCGPWRPDLVTEQDCFDIAAATQKLYELLFEKILAKARALSTSDNLVLMGGCALNCSANPLAFKYFKHVWIMPAPGDSGSAMGAVLSQQQQHIVWTGPYLGYDMQSSASNEEIVDHLIMHGHCGVARGAAEFGPRALGNRSLLADPRDPKIKVLINQIKQRQQFRPFAPAILEEYADSVFFMPTKSTTYMQFICKFREHGSYPSVRHHDDTARVQTINQQNNADFRQLLEMWHDRTGCAMLLNTSLNIKGQPMVNDHTDANLWQKKYGVKVFN